jgi:AcrR family transcriptional regulator
VVATQQPEAEAPAGRSRKPDAERTRRAILAAARQEFAENGLSGARVDTIAARMGTNKRMIYYYFGNKEGLYLATLEQVYSEIRSVEQELDLDRLRPSDAVRRIIEFTFDYHEAHPDFVRLVCIENIHHAKHLARSERVRNLNMTVIQTLDGILQRGRRAGDFRSDIDPVDLHMLISAFCFYRVSNRHTFGTLFGRDLGAADQRRKHKRMIGDAIVGMLESAAVACEPAILALQQAGSGRRDRR